MSNIASKDLGKTDLGKRGLVVFIALCGLVYFTSYITRLNYMAAISEIVNSLQLTNQLAGMAVLGSFIAYGIGQPIFGFLGDRVQPRNMIFTGLIASAACNLLISFMSNIYLMTFIWCLNGIFQSMIWPPLVRIMAQTLSGANYRKAIISVAAAASIGTIAVYVLVPFCIWISGWRLSFIIPALTGFAVSLIWYVGVKPFITRSSHPLKKENSDKPRMQIKTGRLLISAGLIPMMLVTVFQGALRDGITTWMPTYIQDVYHVDGALSILTTGILPIFSVLSVLFATFVHRLANNELKTSTLLWGICFIAIVILLPVFSSYAIWSILLMAIITGCMHGINLMLVSYVPAHFEKYGRVSTISGILNATTYVGSALSIYGFAAISDHLGWQVAIMTWGMIALAGAIICVLRIRSWGRFSEGREAHGI